MRQSASVIDPIRWWAKVKPESSAIVFGTERISYGHLTAWFDRVARQLMATGATKGDRIGLIGSNSVEWCVASLASAAAGCIATGYNYRYVTRELRDVIAGSTPSVVFADAERIETATAAASQLDPTPRILAMDWVREFEHTVAQPGELPEIWADDPVTIVYTSGSMSSPKGVVHTHGGILWGTHEMALMEAGFRDAPKLLLMLPMAAAAGFMRGLVYTLVNGGTVYLEPGVHVERAITLITTERITVLASIPYVFEQIALSPNFADADLSSLVFATAGGSPVLRPLLDTWIGKGVVLRQIWGMTESGGAISVNPPELAATKPHLCGRGGIFTEVTVVDEAGKQSPPNEPGEIVFRGPATTIGYWNDPDATQAAFRGEWFCSGDLGRLDDDGNLEFIGRKKEMIISGGINIAPAEIEMVIGELAAVAEVVVIAAPHRRFGERPCAVVVAREPLSADVVIEHCRGRLAGFKVPWQVAITADPLPRLAGGKLSRRAVVDAFAAQFVES